MKDIQSERDFRRINIKKVGVKNISYPITVLDKARAVQHTIATVNMYVNLPHRFKGTHMSRFVEILNRFHGEIDLAGFHRVLEEMKQRLNAQAAHIEIEFPYFLKNEGRGRGLAISIDEYRCKMHASLAREYDLTLEITVPITAPLPQQGRQALPRSPGHWGLARISLKFRQFIWIEDIIRMVEEVIRERQQADISWYCRDTGEGAPEMAAAVPPGEQEPQAVPAAGETPLSVESITRALGEKLASLRHIRWFAVTVENLARGCSMFASIEHYVN